jgi:hypothetical protein
MEYIQNTLNIKTVITILSVIFILASYMSTPTLSPDKTATSFSTLAIAPHYPTIFPAKVLSTLTIVPSQFSLLPTQLPLPFNDQDIDHKYCQSPAVLLTIFDAQGLSDDDIARKLMELWLAYFNAPQSPGYCRIGSYHIDKVYYDDCTPNLPLEPKGDFMRVVQFQLNLFNYPIFGRVGPAKLTNKIGFILLIM